MRVAAALRRLARMDQHDQPQRASLTSLIVALVATVPVGLYLLCIMALSVGSQAQMDNQDVSSGEIVAVIVVPVVGAVALAAFVITCCDVGGEASGRWIGGPSAPGHIEFRSLC
jgi:hypothetical protein